MNTNQTKEKYYDITAGPSREALFDACKYACSKVTDIPINFTVAMGYTMPKNDPGCAYIPMAIADIKIVGIEHEDGSGESFNLHGYCRADLDFHGGVDIAYQSYKFKAYYNSKSREGCITFIK